MRGVSFVLSALALISAYTVPASAAVTLEVDSSGVLTGATGVDVNGTLYDVSFVDGTCFANFSGCSGPPALPFATSAEAAAAAQALSDQVFVGIYDSNPEKTFGCQSIALCYVNIPYPSNSTYIFVNFTGPVFDQFLNTSLDVNEDFSAFATSTFARFTLASATVSVPEPATWTMMLVGYSGIGFATRRKRRAAPQAA